MPTTRASLSGSAVPSTRRPDSARGGVLGVVLSVTALGGVLAGQAWLETDWRAVPPAYAPAPAPTALIDGARFAPSRKGPAASVASPPPLPDAATAIFDSAPGSQAKPEEDAVAPARSAPAPEPPPPTAAASSEFRPAFSAGESETNVVAAVRRPPNAAASASAETAREPAPPPAAPKPDPGPPTPAMDPPKATGRRASLAVTAKDFTQILDARFPLDDLIYPPKAVMAGPEPFRASSRDRWPPSNANPDRLAGQRRRESVPFSDPVPSPLPAAAGMAKLESPQLPPRESRPAGESLSAIPVVPAPTTRIFAAPQPRAIGEPELFFGIVLPPPSASNSVAIEQPAAMPPPMPETRLRTPSSPLKNDSGPGTWGLGNRILPYETGGSGFLKSQASSPKPLFQQAARTSPAPVVGNAPAPTVAPPPLGVARVEPAASVRSPASTAAAYPLYAGRPVTAAPLRPASPAALYPRAAVPTTSLSMPAPSNLPAAATIPPPAVAPAPAATEIAGPGAPRKLFSADPYERE